MSKAEPAGIVPPITIINQSSASASAASGQGGPRSQSLAVHLLLFMVFPIFGNALYAWRVHHWNRLHGWA